jgi:hypothetical protein
VDRRRARPRGTRQDGALRAGSPRATRVCPQLSPLAQRAAIAEPLLARAEDAQAS